MTIPPELAAIPRADEGIWCDWEPTERATLCFVIRRGEILLILKKRGLGAGKVNGPGGRVEPGETEHDCAVRETQEELGVTPRGLDVAGILHFQFTDGYKLQCMVFRAEDCEGDPVETDEAVPRWTRVDSVPYDEMWADDIRWLPGVIAGGRFLGYFEFDGERMLTERVFWSDETR